MQAWLWLENHGEAAARVLASSRQPPSVPSVPECGCREEQPLADWERNFLSLHLDSRSEALTPREVRILRARLGADGPPQPLARIALELSLTRERVRQIEVEALGKIGIQAPGKAHTHKSGSGWKCARVVLRELAGPRAPAVAAAGRPQRSASGERS
ncbi:MAG: sigma factor-like helix-turn-helix DNA-binding protein [Acidobacteriota bacterium]